MCLSIQYIKDPFSFSLFRHDVAEVAGLTSFSFGEDEESRYVMLFKKVCNFFFFVITTIKQMLFSLLHDCQQHN